MADFSKDIDLLEGVFSVGYGENSVDDIVLLMYTRDEEGLKKKDAVFSEKYLPVAKRIFLKYSGSDLERIYLIALDIAKRNHIESAIKGLVELKLDSECISNPMIATERARLKERLMEQANKNYLYLPFHLRHNEIAQSVTKEPNKKDTIIIHTKSSDWLDKPIVRNFILPLLLGIFLVLLGALVTIYFVNNSN